MSRYVFSVQRSLGVDHPRSLLHQFCRDRESSLDLSLVRTFDATPCGQAVTALSLDYQEGRYLLGGGHGSDVFLYDTEDIPVGTRGPHTIAPSITAKRVAAEVAVANEESRGTGRSIPIHQRMVSSVQWYPRDNGMFVSGGYDGRIIVWDAGVFQPVMVFQNPETQYVYACEMPTAGQTQCLVAASTNESVIRLYDLRTLASAQTLVGHKGESHCLSWSPRSEYQLCSGDALGHVYVWDVRHSANCVLSLEQHDATGHLPTRNKRRRVADRPGPSSNDTGLIAAYRPGVGAGRQAALLHARTRDRTAHKGVIHSVKYTPDGRYILTRGQDRRIRLWDGHTGANSLVHYPKLQRKQLDPRASAHVQVNETGAIAYIAEEDTILMLDIVTGKKIKTLSAHYDSVTSLQAGRNLTRPVLFSGARDKQLFCWEHPYQPNVANVRAEDQDGWDDEDNWSD